MGNRYGLSPLTETAPDLRGGKDKLRNGVRDAVGIENEVKVWDKVRIRKRGGSKMNERSGSGETRNGGRQKWGET